MTDEELQTIVGALAKSVAELTSAVALDREQNRQVISELREGQALLTRYYSQLSDQLVELRRSTNRNLDQLDQTISQMHVALRENTAAIHRAVDVFLDSQAVGG